MSSAPDPVFDRYFVTIRRLWWVIAATTVVGTAALLLVTARPDYAGSIALTPLDDSGPLAVAELPDNLITRRVSLDDELTYLESLKPEIEGDFTSDFDVFVSLSSVPPTARPAGADTQVIQTLTIAASSRDRETVAGVLNVYEEKFRQRRAENIVASVKDVQRALDGQMQSAQDRVAALDSQLQAVSPEDNLLSQALQIERSDRADDLNAIAAEVRIVDDYSADTDNRVAKVGGSIRRPTSGVVLGGIAGLIVGAVFGFIIVGVVMLFDKRLRTGGDIQTATGLPLLGLSGTGEDESEQLVAVLAALSPSGNSSLTIVALDEHTRRSPELETLVQRCQAAMPTTEVRVRTVGETLASADRGPAERLVLTASWGDSRLSDLRAASRALEIADFRVTGVAVLRVSSRLADAMYV